MKPKLIIGGTSKSGTTAIYHYFRQHPEICLPKKKELHFFSRPWLEKYATGPGDSFVLAEIPKSFEEYMKNFSHCDNTKISVDISPSYLFHYQAADQIKKHLDNVKIAFILRNPADKVFSQYMHLIGEGRETLGFSEALKEEPNRKSENYSDMWLYKKSGLYSDGIEYFQKVLGKDNIKIFYYEEFLNNPSFVLGEICTFSGIDSNINYHPEERVNRSGTPRSKTLAKLLAPNVLTYLLRRIIPQNLGRIVRSKLKGLNAGGKPELDQELRISLMKYFSEDIRKVELLIGRSSGWLK